MKATAVHVFTHGAETFARGAEVKGLSESTLKDLEKSGLVKLSGAKAADERSNKNAGDTAANKSADARATKAK